MKRSKVKVTRHKNIVSVSLCTLVSAGSCGCLLKSSVWLREDYQQVGGTAGDCPARVVELTRFDAEAQSRVSRA